MTHLHRLMERETPAQADAPQPNEGFVRRVLFAACDKALQAGRAAGPIVNGQPLTETAMRGLVAYAHGHGFLT